jgi:putative phosphoribosyl transferase
MQRYADRADAGRRLAECLLSYQGSDVLVLGLPRGGVPVAFEVAAVLKAPLDVLVVRKLGVPSQPELAFGAIGEGGVRVINDNVLWHVPVCEADIAEVEAAQRAELQRRVERYRGDRAPQPLAGRVVIIVDDGFATGSTARAACLVARAQGVAKLVLAAPIGSPDTIVELGSYADEVICPGAPRYFSAVGQGYDNFNQTSDEEVTTLLKCAEHGFTQG